MIANASNGADGGPAEHSETLQVYLRAVLELHEAGVLPRRARLVERLKVTAPAVSETVARLAAQGYLVLDEDKVLHLTRRGQLIASDVVRRHELAYRFLHDVLHLDPATQTPRPAPGSVLTTQVEHALQQWLGQQQTCSAAPVAPLLRSRGVAAGSRPDCSATPPRGPG